MNRLLELGISDNDFRNMLEQEPNIVDMNYDEINEKVEILRYVGCTDRQIKNIVVSNPNYLDRSNNDILKLIKYLMELGFSSLNLLFEANPYFVNYDAFEIRDYIDNLVSKGITLEDIIDKIESNPYIIDEE